MRRCLLREGGARVGPETACGKNTAAATEPYGIEREKTNGNEYAIFFRIVIDKELDDGK